MTRHRREYWVGISRRAAPALLYLIVARDVFFICFMGCALVSSGAEWVVWAEWECNTIPIQEHSKNKIKKIMNPQKEISGGFLF